LFKKINELILDSNNDLSKLSKKIADVSNLIPINSIEAVSIKAIPNRMFELLELVKIYLTASTGAKIPLLKQGEGTQSLAVMMLFNAVTKSRLTNEYMTDSSPLLTLEENNLKHIFTHRLFGH
jgi:putative ATP-dependent endonuclease of OLD family